MYSYLQSTAFLMVTEHFYIPYILVSIPGLIFMFSILLFLFVSASEATYVCICLPLVATLCVFQDLPQYCMKWTVDTQLLNSHQQHTAAIYISVCVMWHKEHQYTVRTANYSRSHSHISNQTNSSYWLSVLSGHGTAGKFVQWQPIYSREFIRSN